jgi:hypothetical protein
MTRQDESQESRIPMTLSQNAIACTGQMTLAAEAIGRPVCRATNGHAVEFTGTKAATYAMNLSPSTAIWGT